MGFARVSPDTRTPRRRGTRACTSVQKLEVAHRPHGCSMMFPGYESCAELSRNEWFLLYRGRAQEDGRPILLKTPHRDPASPFEVRLLEHEWEILQGLVLPGVIRVRELLRYD